MICFIHPLSLTNPATSRGTCSGTLAVYIALACSFNALADPPSPAPATEASVDDAYTGITIFAQNDWFLSISPDGGGVYGFGDGGPLFSATIPRGTFKLSDIIELALVISTKRGPADGEAPLQRIRGIPTYSVGLSRRGSSFMESRDTGNIDFGRDIFAKAIAVATPGPELARLLQTKRPFPAELASQRPSTTKPAIEKR